MRFTFYLFLKWTKMVLSNRLFNETDCFVFYIGRRTWEFVFKWMKVVILLYRWGDMKGMAHRVLSGTLAAARLYVSELQKFCMLWENLPNAMSYLHDNFHAPVIRLVGQHFRNSTEKCCSVKHCNRRKSNSLVMLPFDKRMTLAQPCVEPSKTPISPVLGWEIDAKLVCV